MPTKFSDSSASSSSSRSTRSFKFARELLGKAGIGMEGRAPWDMTLNDVHVPEKVLAEGNLGLGEAYVNGEWDARHPIARSDHAG